MLTVSGSVYIAATVGYIPIVGIVSVYPGRTLQETTAANGIECTSTVPEATLKSCESI